MSSEKTFTCSCFAAAASSGVSLAFGMYWCRSGMSSVVPSDNRRHTDKRDIRFLRDNRRHIDNKETFEVQY